MSSDSKDKMSRPPTGAGWLTSCWGRWGLWDLSLVDLHRRSATKCIVGPGILIIFSWSVISYVAISRHAVKGFSLCSVLNFSLVIGECAMCRRTRLFAFLMQSLRSRCSSSLRLLGWSPCFYYRMQVRDVCVKERGAQNAPRGRATPFCVVVRWSLCPAKREPSCLLAPLRPAVFNVLSFVFFLE